MEDDRIYSFTVRTLYLVALVLNGAVIWDQARDTDFGRRVRSTLAQARETAMGRLTAAKNLRAAESWVVWEAMNILEGTTDAD